MRIQLKKFKPKGGWVGFDGKRKMDGFTCYRETEILKPRILGTLVHVFADLFRVN